MTTQLEKVLYTAHTHTTGGRDGQAKSDDGRLNVTLSSPGTAGNGTNPEQLFAAGYSACFIGALKAVAGMQKITLPDDVGIDASVDLGKIPNGYGIAVRLEISLPGMEAPPRRRRWSTPRTRSARTRTPRAATST